MIFIYILYFSSTRLVISSYDCYASPGELHFRPTSSSEFCRCRRKQPQQHLLLPNVPTFLVACEKREFIESRKRLYDVERARTWEQRFHSKDRYLKRILTINFLFSSFTENPSNLDSRHYRVYFKICFPRDSTKFSKRFIFISIDISFFLFFIPFFRYVSEAKSPIFCRNQNLEGRFWIQTISKRFIPSLINPIITAI